MTCGALLVLGAFARPAWAQEVAKPEQDGGNGVSWAVVGFGFGVVYFVFLMIYVLRRQKFQKGLVDRSLKLSEERNELARQQLAAQAETNRLLERLIAERGEA
jgi:hypothetical protein